MPHSTISRTQGHNVAEAESGRVTFAIGIVAHPARNEQAHHLAAQVEADVIVVDSESRGEQWCHQATLTELLKRDVDSLVLLEDDALPCANFRDVLNTYLSQSPDGIVSLYLGTGRWAGINDTEGHARTITALIQEAETTNSQWIRGTGLWHAVGVVIPRRHSPSALAFMRKHPRTPTDFVLNVWARKQALPVLYTWPSLVDHADTPRLVATSDTEAARVAWRVHT